MWYLYLLSILYLDRCHSVYGVCSICGKEVSYISELKNWRVAIFINQWKSFQQRCMSPQSELQSRSSNRAVRTWETTVWKWGRQYRALPLKKVSNLGYKVYAVLFFCIKISFLEVFLFGYALPLKLCNKCNNWALQRALSTLSCFSWADSLRIY